MDRSVTNTIGGGQAGLAALALLAGVLLGTMAAPASAAAQAGTAPADTVPGDTVPADSTLTPRQRALQRLRDMPVTPIQRDTLADSVAIADTIPADTPLTRLPDELTPMERDDPGARPPPGVVRAPPVVLQDDGRDDPGAMVADSVLAQLRSLTGYAVTDYSGQGAVFNAETGELELTGESRVGQGTESLASDSLLVYDRESGVVCAYGAPVLTGEQDPIESDELCYDIQRNMGVALGARTTFQQGATWYVRGADNRVYLLTGDGKNALYGERTQFTSCDLDHPHYTFNARSLKMVEDEVMVARNITLEFEDVPVFWLPWMVQSMKRDRRSGLLMPEFGVNDIVRNSTGYNRSISNLGFYWAINDYTSAKSTFEWYSNNWTAVQGAVTYKWLRQFLQGNVSAKQYWRQRDGVPGRKEFTLNTTNSWQPDERSRINLNANYASSSDFVRDNSFDPRELNRKITSSASANRSFRWGSMSLGADRSEQLSTGQIDWKLPSLSLSVSPVTLYTGDALNVTWNASSGLTRRTRHVPDTLGTRDSDVLDANYRHNLSVGRLGLSQSVTWQDERLQGPVPASAFDPLPGGLSDTGLGRTFENVGGRGFRLGETTAEQLGWSTSLSYQQVLWAGTTVSPSVSVNGAQVRDERTAGEFVDEPNRISAGASLNTAIFGFWPGFGNFSRVRHKIAPSLRWSYSPKPEYTDRQAEVFGIRNLREQNRLTLSFNQTFEAKVRESELADSVGADPEAGEETAGTGANALAAAGAGRAGTGAAGSDGAPRRLPRAETVMLLSVDTRTSFVYDFVAAAEDGRGYLTEDLSNSIRSDLLRGLQITVKHSLFEKEPAPGPGELQPRRFDPFLEELTTSFSIDNNFWLFGFLGLTSTADDPAGPGGGSEPPEDAEGVAGSQDPSVGAESDPERAGGTGSMIPNQGANRERIGSTGVGGWRAALNYSMRRSRPGVVGARDNQLLSGNISFKPTQHWDLRWSTAYSFTESEFANHVLTLSRDLHRWTANFDFIKAQNGNFLFTFRVQLRDNPDLKLDYDQKEGPAERAGRSPTRTVR